MSSLGTGSPPLRWGSHCCELFFPGSVCTVLFSVCCTFSGLTSPTAAVAQSATSRAAVVEGIQLLRTGQALQAKEAFDNAIKLAPRSADALTWRGICENQLEQYSAAAIDFRGALRTAPSMLSAHYNLALSLIRLHQTDGAIEQLRIVVKAQPQGVQPLYNLAILLEAKGAFREAVEHLDAARTLAPRDKGVTLHLLLDDLKLQHTDTLPIMLQELEEDSTPPVLQRQAGTGLLEAGRFSDAVALLKIVESREPSAPEIDLLLARALIGNEQNEEAISLLSGTGAAAQSEERTYLLALAYTGAGDLQEAAENFQVATKLAPRDARPLYHLGLLAETTPQGQAEAVKLLRAATRLDVRNPAYPEALARVLLTSDHPEAAKAVLAKMPAVGEDVQRHALMGVALAATHEVAAAVPELEKAVQEDSSLAVAYNVLGFCRFQQGQYPEAAAAYGRASELVPNRLLYAQDAALAFERANNSEQALRFAERVQSLPGVGAPDHVLLGKLYAGAGRRQDAVRELHLAAELDPELDSALYLLARTYMQMGDREHAAEWSSKLAALKQRHESAFALQKKAAAQSIRSSALLHGGMLSAGDAVIP